MFALFRLRNTCLDLTIDSTGSDFDSRSVRGRFQPFWPVRSWVERGKRCFRCVTDIWHLASLITRRNEIRVGDVTVVRVYYGRCEDRKYLFMDIKGLIVEGLIKTLFADFPTERSAP